MSQLQRVSEVDSQKLMKIVFESTGFYNPEVLKHKTKHASVRDKVQGFNEASAWWEQDRFLAACHGEACMNNETKEGRKLNIASFEKKFASKPL